MTSGSRPSERTETTVEVRPSDPTKKADVTAAEQTRVEFANGHLLVKAPSGWRQWMPHRGGGSIDVEIGLPEGSRVRVEAGVGAVHGRGRLGECECKVGVGEIRLDETGRLNLKTGAGDISMERAAGKAEIVTGSGAVRIGSIDGTAAVKNSNGDTWIGEVSGATRVKAANGSISVDRVHEGIVVKTANGDVRIGEVARGAAVAQTAFGKIEVGVLDGVAAWLDLHTKFGNVHNAWMTLRLPRRGWPRSRCTRRPRSATSRSTVRSRPMRGGMRRDRYHTAKREGTGQS